MTQLLRAGNDDMFLSHSRLCRYYKYSVGLDDVEAFLPVALERGHWTEITGHFLIRNQQSPHFDSLLYSILSAAALLPTTEFFDEVLTRYETFLQRQSPLTYSVIWGRVRLMNLLLERGWCVNVCNENRMTPLKAAIYTQHSQNLEVMKLLYDHGADLTLETPLKFAVICRNYEAVKFLLDHGASTEEMVGEIVFGADERIVRLFEDRLHFVLPPQFRADIGQGLTIF